GNGRADQRVSLSHGHGIHVGYGRHDMHGPTMGPDGRIYWSQGDKGYNITSKEERNFAHPYEGAVFRVDPVGSNLEVFAWGLGNYSDGPCGFKYNPGTALSEEYKGHFFLTQFPKKLITTFRAEADGAGFKMVGERVAFSGLMMTGIDFGPDKAIYSTN